MEAQVVTGTSRFLLTLDPAPCRALQDCLYSRLMLCSVVLQMSGLSSSLLFISHSLTRYTCTAKDFSWCYCFFHSPFTPPLPTPHLVPTDCPSRPSLCCRLRPLTRSVFTRLRRDGRTNGTAILRRTSTTPFTNQAAPNTAASALENSLATSAHDPAAASPADSTAARYSREELLDLSRMARAHHPVHIRDLLMESFDPYSPVNGNSARGWGKPSDSTSYNDPAACWDGDGSRGPLGYQDMSPEEREVSYHAEKSLTFRLTRPSRSRYFPSLQLTLPCVMRNSSSLPTSTPH